MSLEVAACQTTSLLRVATRNVFFASGNVWQDVISAREKWL
jgi:hypothetical protein